ncbi:hypothetical protein RX331_23835 [Bradyrhizobium sp. BWA-3-5]|nr:hypothetical protein [Bradyrhizobium sp. BWA-3-5]WOH63727.1 hypothetical protein RX331_23835 [Bradyrhizobium sp. BWA-3-5]
MRAFVKDAEITADLKRLGIDPVNPAIVHARRFDGYDNLASARLRNGELLHAKDVRTAKGVNAAGSVCRAVLLALLFWRMTGAAPAPAQALASIGLKKLIGLPSGSRNSIERLPQGISFGCCSQSVTKASMRSRSTSTSSTSNSGIAERLALATNSRRA